MRLELCVPVSQKALAVAGPIVDEGLVGCLL